MPFLSHSYPVGTFSLYPLGTSPIFYSLKETIFFSFKFPVLLKTPELKPDGKLTDLPFWPSELPVKSAFGDSSKSHQVLYQTLNDHISP